MAINRRHNVIPMRLCRRCGGIGIYEYLNDATYNTAAGVKSTAGINWDTCDVCWGTGDEGNPGPDLRRHKL